MSHQDEDDVLVSDDLFDDDDQFDGYGTHPLVVSSVAILAFLALLHTIALPLAYVIEQNQSDSEAGYGPMVLAYIIAAIVSALVLGYGSGVASKRG